MLAAIYRNLALVLLYYLGKVAVTDTLVHLLISVLVAVGLDTMVSLHLTIEPKLHHHNALYAIQDATNVLDQALETVYHARKGIIFLQQVTR